MEGRAPLGTLEGPCLLHPYARSLVWGGRQLAERYQKGAPGQRIAESWELSDRADGACSLSSVHALEGAEPCSLGTLRGDDGARLFGPGVVPEGRGLPVLFKLIDAAERLSVQVHPGRRDLDDVHDLGKRSLAGAESKEEAWLIVSAEPGAQIYLGLQPGTSREAFRGAIRSGRVEELLHSVDVRAGDVFHVSPGVFHAIGAGVLLAEVQQSSDTTYRVWDWGRVGDDGRPRALHVEQALSVGRFDLLPPERVRLGTGVLPSASEDLVRGDGFQMDWRRAGPGAPLDPGRDRDRFAVYCLLDLAPSGQPVDSQDPGQALSVSDPRSGASFPWRLGQSLLLPPRAKAPILSASAGFLKVTVPDQAVTPVV